MREYISAETTSVFDNVFLSLGSNLGDRKMNIFSALAELSAFLNCEEMEISPLYETQAWGNLKQPNYLNCVAKLTFKSRQKSNASTARENAHLEQFLKDMKHIEIVCGRQHSEERWSARTIDIDILLYNDISYQSPQLTIPHPRMQDRKFVLIPLNDIASSLLLPFAGVTVEAMLENCNDQSSVSLFNSNAKSNPDLQSNGVNG